MIDITRLAHPDDVRQVIANCKRRGPEADGERRKAEKHLARLLGVVRATATDPALRALEEDAATAFAYYDDVVLYRKHGKHIKAQRTRQEMARKGLIQTMIDHANRAGVSDGFAQLVEASAPEFTDEYVIVRHRKLFPPEIVEKAKDTLRKHGIDIPS